jgi:Flp pilus assembly protein TadG
MHIRLRKIRFLRRINRRAGITRLARNERGVQLAELAIVLPLLVIMFAATAEFGRYFYAYTTLAKASRMVPGISQRHVTRAMKTRMRKISWSMEMLLEQVLRSCRS